jgi:hypothetical protein
MLKRVMAVHSCSQQVRAGLNRGQSQSRRQTRYFTKIKDPGRLKSKPAGPVPGAKQADGDLGKFIIEVIEEKTRIICP